jgi:Tat protein secretion system quality control protein TatD with DNase activity
MEYDDYWIDSHCHLHDYSEEELQTVIPICENYNINFILSNATHEENFSRTLEISSLSNKPKIIPGIGHHPWFLHNIVAYPKWFDDYKQYILKLKDEGKLFFIGEIGIDGGKPKK